MPIRTTASMSARRWRSSRSLRALNAASDVYTVPVAGGPPTQLTFDGQSTNPVCGPTQIAYSNGPRRRTDFPQLNLWLMNPDGSADVAVA